MYVHWRKFLVGWKHCDFVLRKKKCQFMVPSVAYIGHQVDASGLYPLPDKVRAIEEDPGPNSVTELKSYLGLLTYYGKFLLNSATQLAPLYQLLQKDSPWMWGQNRSHFNPQRIYLRCHGYWYTSTYI